MTSNLRLGAAALALALLAGQAAAQPARPGAPPAAPGPMTTDPRDFSGVWQTPGFDRRTKPMDGSETPWLPWVKEMFDKRAQAEKDGAPMFDPTAACMPSGNPRIIAAPYPIEIIHTPDKVVMLHEVQHLFRVFHLNGKFPEKLEPSFNGYSVAHWEGNTLVVETKGITGKTQIDEAGTMHTDQIHVVERITKIDDNTFEDVFTITDPGAFTKPWTARRLFRKRPEIRFLEYVCEENNRNAPNAQGVLRNF